MAFNIEAGIKLDTVMRNGVRALKRRLNPILSVSTVIRDVMLEGTDKVKVPFYPLDSLASKNFSGTYDFTDADAAINGREVAINRRKYKPLKFSSAELRRQPMINLEQTMTLIIEKLAEDVLTDIFSVVTEANYGAAILTSTAAAFDTDSLIDVRTALNTAHWPQTGRALILESTYDGNLMKDDSIKHALNAGGSEVIRQGVVPNILGFNYYEFPGLPENGENLVGAVVLPYAILAAFSPIEPADEVRANMSDYRAYTDPESGLTLEYRAWGDPDSDSAKRTVEVNYGFAKGDAAQLKRIVKP